MNRKSLFLSLFIGQIFIWTGSAFMTVLYHLYDYYDGTAVTLVTEGLYYVMQAAGIIVFALFYKHRSDIAGKSVLVSASILFTATLTVISLVSASGRSILLSGCLMNVGIGVMSGQLFTRIALHIPRREHGIVFGAAYALGSIGTYLISLPNHGQGLTSEYVLYLYLAMMALSLICSRYLTDDKATSDSFGGTADRQMLVLAFAVPFLCYLVYTLGYHFATMDMSAGVNPAFTRAFYAVSLIAAGLINDRNRKTGTLLGFLILIFPFVSLALRNTPGTAILLCILSYLFLGFLSVYRVLLFTDLASGYPDLAYMAPFGLMLGTLGTAVGTAAGIYIDKDQLVLTLVTTVFFLICGVLFFYLFTKIHLAAAGTKKSAESLLYDFQVKYSLNANQMEILKLILGGNSNGQIAEELHLAESTIKYHVKNILKATGCGNRNDLITLFHDFCI